ncbi:MAG: hypothetical protein NTU49_00240 [Gammaproteobacteria bacterium]|nr:hypothetical protein [Gammaproteobacteria bacterium]
MPEEKQPNTLTKEDIENRLQLERALAHYRAISMACLTSTLGGLAVIAYAATHTAVKRKSLVFGAAFFTPFITYKMVDKVMGFNLDSRGK